MQVSDRAVIVLADALRHRRTVLGSRRRRLSTGEQALRSRYVRDGVDVLAAVGADSRPGAGPGPP
ncbi:MAG: hypothetical protein QOK35_2617 [Pseudonocardiales bacterium]|nr:hypothetical protein [Pseudonocardiales bacterium]